MKDYIINPSILNEEQIEYIKREYKINRPDPYNPENALRDYSCAIRSILIKLFGTELFKDIK